MSERRLDQIGILSLVIFLLSLWVSKNYTFNNSTKAKWYYDPVIQKLYILFSIDDPIANIRLYVLARPKVNSRYYLTVYQHFNSKNQRNWLNNIKRRTLCCEIESYIWYDLFLFLCFQDDLLIDWFVKCSFSRCPPN